MADSADGSHGEPQKYKQLIKKKNLSSSLSSCWGSMLPGGSVEENTDS